MPSKIMIIAGEASGDLHGGQLVRELFSQDREAEIFGMGGDLMRNAGMELYYHVDDLAYIGFFEIIRHLGFFYRIFSHLVKEIRRRKPDVLVLIDYPGFNLRLARKAQKMGIRIFYYIAPQVWAWGQSRAQKMGAFIDKMAVIFDFEVDFFKKAGIDAVFVGHPLLDVLKFKKTRQDFFTEFHLDPDRPVLALLPGSRKQEIENLLPIMLDTVKNISAQHPEVQITVSQAPTIGDSLIQEIVSHYHCAVVVKSATYEQVKYATAAIVASGTATLETALLNTPFVIGYKVSPVSYFIGKCLIKIPYIGLVNVVAGEKVVPEFIQQNFNAQMLTPIVKKLLYDEEYRREHRARLAGVQQKLGQPGAALRTAKLVMETIHR
ncbi:lipid-A-disaccharide synthase [candidate division KSB1 bacterium]|nr:lipid-A-disaccharide synthase [candidate division KSB1 bacterium]